MPDRGELTAELTIPIDDGVSLSGEQAGSGPAVVLLHGLTATRRYVVMGSRLLERSGLRVISYDARGHGRSTPATDRIAASAPSAAPGPAAAAAPSAYAYERLAADLLAVLDSLEVDRAILVGASMGAHTLARFALDHPDRVDALALITPAYDPASHPTWPEGFAGWDALARGLREGGVEGFLAAYDLAAVPERWRGTVEKVVRQRLSEHQHPLAVADALEVVPRSRPFERLEELALISAPTLVIPSRDEADPTHPLAVGERYAQAIPGARLLVEDPGRSPIAWQGGRLSKALLALATGASSV